MEAKIVKLSDEELATCKLRDITNVVKGKFSEDEINQLKTVSEEVARRELIISLYKKYIDEVVEEANGTPPDANENSKSGDTDINESQQNSNPEDNSNVTATSETKVKDANINVFFTVSVRGVTGYSGTVTCSCEHLLKIAFLNPKTAIIEFRTAERAKQFIDIIKKVEHVKGLSKIPENTRSIVINRIKEINDIK